MRSIWLRTVASSASLALVAPATRWVPTRAAAASAFTAHGIASGHSRSRLLVASAGMSPGWEPPPGFVNIEDDDADGSLEAPPWASDNEDADQPWPPRRRPPPPPPSPPARGAAALEAELTVPRGVCSGCGARFQSEDDAAPGFAPSSVLDARSGSAVCQRCHGLRYQNRLPVDALRVGSGEAAHSDLQPQHFLDLLGGISRQRALVVAIVDLFDFHGSLVPDLAKVVGPDNDLILAANKFDLLPGTVDAKSVERWVRAEARRARLPALASVHLVSCKTGSGLPKLFDEIQYGMGRRRLDCYVIGAANAGKSSFINHCLRHANSGRGGRGGKGGSSSSSSSSAAAAAAASSTSSAVEKRMLTTSHLPGTTLGFVRLSVFSGRHSLYDTPGVILPNQLTTKLTTEELALVVPKKRAEHVTLRVAEGKCIMLGGIARVHMRSGLPFLFTFYLANAVKIHPTDSSKVEQMLEKHVGAMLAPPASRERLEEMGAFEETSFDIDGRGWDEAAVDLVLPGLGWVAITGCGQCTVSIELPGGVSALSREPLIADEGGKGARRSQVKFTGSKLRDRKGNTKRTGSRR